MFVVVVVPYAVNAINLCIALPSLLVTSLEQPTLLFIVQSKHSSHVTFSTSSLLIVIISWYYFFCIQEKILIPTVSFAWEENLIIWIPELWTGAGASVSFEWIEIVKVYVIAHISHCILWIDVGQVWGENAALSFTSQQPSVSSATLTSACAHGIMFQMWQKSHVLRDVPWLWMLNTAGCLTVVYQRDSNIINKKVSL